jgi:glycosyltransferase involved in cell wall biosynthesis
MGTKELSILIPARNEMFLSRTIQDILEHMEDDTEIIAVLDGAWAEPAVPQHERVTVVYLPESIGQRAATNLACKLAKGKYVMKVDAHCAFRQGFDKSMIKAFKRSGDNVTMIPVMRNLHAFDWVCTDGHRRYQGPSGVCAECGKETTRDVVWIPKTNPQSKAYCFDSEPHFQYTSCNQEGDLTESMSIQGSCFMLTREKYWELNICDESLGSWGSQGIEVACKTWLSGGRVLVNHRTWYAHLFRTAGGDFSFPYPQQQSKVEEAKKKSKDLFFNNKWEKQVRPLSWLVEKFWPVKGWSDEDLANLKQQKTKGVVYISDVRLAPSLLKKCQDQLRKSFKGRIVSVTLKPIDFGENIVLPLERGKLTLFKQILAGLEALDTDYVFLCDDDVLYHPSHFDFTPSRDDTYYYNLAWWRLRTSDGFAVHYDAKQSNFLVANRKLLIEEYKERVRRTEIDGSPHGGYEPGTRSIRRGGFSDSRSETYRSEFPSVDIRHGKNLTHSKWKPEDFAQARSCPNWVNGDIHDIKGWDNLSGMIQV